MDTNANGTHALNRLAEANHRIANHMMVLSGMVQLQAAEVGRGPQTLTKAEVELLLREAAGKIQAVGQLHRKLSSHPESDEVDLGQHLIDVCQALVGTLSFRDERVRFAFTCSADCRIAPDKAHTIALIVNEIVMNAIKYAHPTGIPVEISVLCHRDTNGTLSLDVSDDGVGLPVDFDINKAGAFRVLRSLAQTLDARLDILSGDLGVNFHLTVQT